MWQYTWAVNNKTTKKLDRNYRHRDTFIKIIEFIKIIPTISYSKFDTPYSAMHGLYKQ